MTQDCLNSLFFYSLSKKLHNINVDELIDTLKSFTPINRRMKL